MRTLPMTARVAVILLLLASALASWAGDLSTALFTATPTPALGECLLPRSVLADPSTNRLYLLDSGLSRIVALGLNGDAITAWPFSSLGLDDPAALPPDPLLAQPVLAIAGDTIYLLTPDRPDHQVALTTVDGPGTGRIVTVPVSATYGALALDAGGKLLVAYLHSTGNKLELVLAREGEDGATTTLAQLPNPCDGQMLNLNLSGITVGAGGRVAIGIAQSGAANYSFVRSWLVQGTFEGGNNIRDLRVTHRFSLLDPRGKPLDRFRPAIELAGRNGYPAKPCVPLFTALAFGPNGAIVSGGHTTDPFLRVYAPDGRLVRSQPRTAVGGQHLSALSRRGEVRLFATNPAASRIDEISLDGRVLQSWGTPLAGDLSRPAALAADDHGLYVAARQSGVMQLLHYDKEGQLLWTQRLTPPRGLESAQVALAAPLTGDRVFVGWRQPGATGVSWVDTVMDDGMPGLPLWSEVVPRGVTAEGVRSPSPLLTGATGRIYVLRETKDGPRVAAFSSAGVLLQQFPPAVHGVTAVIDNGDLAWAHSDEGGMVISRFSAQGEDRGWKRVPRAAARDLLLPAQAHGVYGWLASTQSLLRLDENFAVVDDSSLLAPSGEKLDSVLAVAGDGNSRLYFAQSNRILVLELH